MNKFLYPLSFLYELLSKADKSFTKTKKLSKPVISVGNLTWGGAGKTPIVIELAKFIASKGKKPAILTRGYGRKNKKPVLLQNGGEKISIADSGDEPILIAKTVPQASVIVGAKRYENSLLFQKDIEPDIYILDDGFQHWKIERDLDIVCINAANPFGNNMLIPAGNLRERPEALKRAGLIIITNANSADKDTIEKLESQILKLSGNLPIQTYYGNYEYKTTDLKTSFDDSFIKKQTFFSLSGIGFAKGFKNSLKDAGVKVEGNFELRDHQVYTKEKLEKIISSIGKSYIITTAKDAVKLNEIADENMKSKIIVFSIQTIFKNGEDIWKNKISNILAYS